jgi:hypothetical protein
MFNGGTMTTNHKPASALPWNCGSIAKNITDSGGEYVAECGGNTDARYIAHAANAYPGLVADAKAILEAFMPNKHPTLTQEQQDALDNLNSSLIYIGEDA